MAFITTAPLTLKSTTTAAACGTSIAYARPNACALRRSAFAGSEVVNAPRPYQGGKWSLTSMSVGVAGLAGVVTKAEVESAQAKWAEGVVRIGSLKDNRVACEAFTDQFLNERYAFDIATVLFKPTKCADKQFRPNKADALSYFIAGGKKQYDEDSGFAVTPWTAVRFENKDFILENGRAFAMGNYYFTDLSGGQTKVEYTFGYKKVNGELKIDLHHSSLPFPSSTGTSTAITQAEVELAQTKWANGVVQIGSLKDNSAACEKFTDQFLNERYAFDMGKVLFKPTKCADQQFRPTKAEALSYFIAGNKKQYAEDSGFAVTPWTNVRFENKDFILEADRAFAMGNYYFTDTSGGQTKVEYTFGYKKVNGELKIDLHHSSLPFPSPAKSSPAITQAEVEDAQAKWANGVVKIGSLKDSRAECEAFTDQFLNDRYAFDSGSVLFKPTKCAVQQFRPTKSDALSYFIAGGKKLHQEDTGFAVTPWTAVRFENSEFILDNERAVAMGNYYFTDLSGGQTKVEYTFGYKKVDGVLKIELHHSSLPFPNPPITQEEVESAQAKWADGVVKIGSLKDHRQACEMFTENFLDERYAFDLGNVLFKPTKCAVQQFRPTKADAISYFIAGGKKQHDEDTGFAITPWTNVRFENSEFILDYDRAYAMGNYYFTDLSGGETKVEYTFGYRKVNGDLKIELHHSSLPFPSAAAPGKVTQAEVESAQAKWAQGVVKIGSLKDNAADCELFTDQFLNARYAFDIDTVLFKPTKCAVQQFRPTKSEALSYFIAGNKKQYDEDSGFAVTPWTNVRFENKDFILEDGRAFAMGNYYFTDLSGGETKVEYTFGYKKVDGDLKIDLHHSSLPFPSAPAGGGNIVKKALSMLGKW